ncbi:type VI secretion system membrane subunit TssM [Undibacterium sp. TJN25]|uniref:type VI secretion system membrane subunit TssM n=1 Tax=Undibacterium sp. TJN25 TaxID=3413056 RepID=UPI003BF1F91E
MQRIWRFLTDTRTLVFIGFAALAAFLLIGASSLQVGLVWVGILLGVALLLWLAATLYRRWKARQGAERLGNMLQQQTDEAQSQADGLRRNEVETIRKRMLEAISTIKTSKLGLVSGSAALYELPWYMIIGNPAAGKSTAIANSGLQFPFADKNGKVVHGIGGTRNCDWFFTTDGIILDTAGRYAIHDEDREEWFGFLSLLKKHRKLAPINGIIIAVSITELTSNRPEFGINLAKNLRQRVQELTERLEVFAPVYIVFTKADLIAGFSEFFLDTERSEKDRVWGATLPYNQKNTNQDVLDFFDRSFDELYDGLKQMSLANMSMNRGDRMPPGVFTFPLEFSSIKNSLRAFIATLFEENPFQFKPVFRGFYLTSALQEGSAVSASSERIADRFNLKLLRPQKTEITSQHGFFLLDLFRKVIFADKDLVAQYASRTKIRLRYAAFFAATALVGLSLAAWSWSYVANRQLTMNVQADLDKAIRLQDRKLDLQSRFEALEVLQERIEQLEKYHDIRPLSLGFGLYQGDLLESKLREEYFSGIKEVMLKPVAANLESFLTDMNAAGDKLEPMARPPQAVASAVSASATATNLGQLAAAPAGKVPRPYEDASPTNVEDAYKALKTYLMLGDRTHAEPGHLNDQLTRFWRSWLESNRGTMTRDDMIRSAERVISFYLAQIGDPSWPVIDNKLSLVDQSRENLRRVVRGMPARDRVYADVKARASTRFPAVTVARIVGDQDKELIAGSYAIPGTFTREAWEKFVSESFKEAANKELQSADWVLKTSAKDDLTLEGSPEQIQKALVDQYKAEYTKEWQKFMQGITVADLNGFGAAVNAMNRLGDPQSSPISKLINTVYKETSWDNPSMVDAGIQRAQRGFIGWFKETILRQAPSQMNISLDINAPKTDIPVGPIGREFSGIAKLVVVKDKDASLLRGYMDDLSKLRSRFNQLKNQGDTGPGAKQLMQQTLDGNGSELADTLKYVDEQMLIGMTDAQKQTLRPILVRPLMQTFAVIIKPTESEMNKIWLAQVYEPFQKTLANKYPFATESKVEASSPEIGQIFGSEGAIAKFVNASMGPLVVRRGDTLVARTWANMGITLAPAVTGNFASWVAPLSAGGVPSANGGEGQWAFQMLPNAAPGTTEYTIEIDGQQLRYRNTQAVWTNLIWPNAQGTPGARVTATTFDGRVIEIVNFPGKFGFKRLIDAATNKRKDGGVFQLSWANGNITVAVDLKIISKPDASADNSNPQGKGFRGMKLPETVLGGGPPAIEQQAGAGVGGIPPAAVNATPVAMGAVK